MKHLRLAGVLLFASMAILYAVALPGYTQNEIMHEQTRSYIWGTDVNVHINAPGKDSLKLDKETIICFFACPAGNTIEWTIGKQMEPGDDWHYDIQHIGAQTRFLRKTLKDKNLIVIYTQTTDNGWNLYSGKHTDHVQRIQAVTLHALQDFSEFDYKVTLNGHSAGGGFVLRNLLNHPEVPAWIDRLGFLDSNYNYKYDADEYDSLFTKFLLERDSTYICLLAYNDSVALYQGSPIVSAQGGTWWNARYMKRRLDPIFNFVDSHDVDFQRHIALDNRFEILLKENPTQAILHTVQVYKNGFIHSMLSGTEYENVGYEYYGEPVYLEYIQGNPPARPEGVRVNPQFGSNCRIEVLPVEDATGYRVYFSADGETFNDTVTINSHIGDISGHGGYLEFIRVTAINQWGESEPTEWLVVSGGDVITANVLLVNAINRSVANEHLIRHGKAMVDPYHSPSLSSCTNSMIEADKIDLLNYEIVDYAVGNEDRRNYTLNSAEIEKLTEYLQAGGNLFISGLEIGYDLHMKGDSTKKAFCEDFLKAECISDKPNDQSSTYYEATMYGLDTSITFQFDDGSHGAYNVGDPDGLVPVNGGYQPGWFTGYNRSVSGMATAFSGTFPGGTSPGRVYFMSVPFEAIVGDSIRNAVMNEVVDFLQNCDVGIDPVDIPQTTQLLAPYPNPFNPRTIISYQLTTNNEIEITIFDLNGRFVSTLFKGYASKGKHQLTWNASAFSSGVYICTMKIDGKVLDSKKMVLVK